MELQTADPGSDPLLACPFCGQGMVRDRLPRKLGGELAIDLCFGCEGLWFDAYESVQLAPEAVVRLFRLIHAHRRPLRQPLAATGYCPRCREGLVPSFDRCRSGRFNYFRCIQDHGRFIAFAQFMIEKGFVRQLSGHEIGELSARIGTVRCTGCGAPVDIRRDTACPHCRAPIAILDADAVREALGGYEAAARGRQPAGTRGLVEAAENVADAGDIVLAGVELIGDLLGSAG